MDKFLLQREFGSEICLVALHADNEALLTKSSSVFYWNFL